jgi:hypothetical protein
MYSGPDTLERVGFPIRTSADQRSLASPRGFSQRATSFIASWRQGIHRTPLSRSISHHHRPHAGPNRALHDKLCMPYQSLNPRPPDILPVAIYPTNPSSLVKEHTSPPMQNIDQRVFWKGPNEAHGGGHASRWAHLDAYTNIKRPPNAPRGASA